MGKSMRDRAGASRIVGVLLAAGSGTRFGGDKLRAMLGQHPLLRAQEREGAAVGALACRALHAALAETVAVVRPGDDVLAALLRGEGARIVECAESAEGMGRSLACGVRAAADADGWVVALADMPWVRASTFDAVATALHDGAPIAAATFDGRRGNPVGFARTSLATLTALGGDRGARDLVTAAGDALVKVAVDDPGVLRDVDLPRDLAP